MKEFIEKLIGRLEELRQTQVEELCEHKDFTSEMQSMRGFNVLQDAIKIVNQLEEEYNGGWITDRNPTREECGEYGHAEFQVTIPQSKGNKTLAMDFVYETVRGKEVARWKWHDRLPIWEVLAWKPLDAPYQPKGE